MNRDIRFKEISINNLRIDVCLSYDKFIRNDCYWKYWIKVFTMVFIPAHWISIGINIVFGLGAINLTFNLVDA